MRILNKSVLLLLTCCLLMSASCGKNNETSTAETDAVAGTAEEQISEKNSGTDTSNAHAEETNLTDISDASAEGQTVGEGDTEKTASGNADADSAEVQTDEEGQLMEGNVNPVNSPKGQSGGEEPGLTDIPGAAENQPVKNIDDCDIYITVQSVDISPEDLKANDYIVPVYVTLDKNAGVNYTEWGVRYDSRCKMETVNSAREHVDFNTVSFVNEDEYFVWTAWAASTDTDDPGTLLKLNVTLPADAKLGDTYPITYANMSLANKPHVWSGTESNWGAGGTVGWKDGGITVAETSTLSVPTFE